MQPKVSVVSRMLPQYTGKLLRSSETYRRKISPEPKLLYWENISTSAMEPTSTPYSILPSSRARTKKYAPCTTTESPWPMNIHNESLTSVLPRSLWMCSRKGIKPPPPAACRKHYGSLPMRNAAETSAGRLRRSCGVLRDSQSAARWRPQSPPRCSAAPARHHRFRISQECRPSVSQPRVGLSPLPLRSPCRRALPKWKGSRKYLQRETPLRAHCQR